MKTKIELREIIRSRLSIVSNQEQLEFSRMLSKNLLYLFFQLNVIQEKKIIGAFSPIKKEPFWYLEFNSDEINGLTAYPVLCEKKMEFKFSNIQELEVRKDFGVEIKSPKLVSETVNPEVIIIPGLAFSKNGERLGRGKGFYDHFLENFKGVKIGVCFETQIEEEIPIEAHDVKMDYLITEKNIFTIKEY